MFSKLFVTALTLMAVLAAASPSSSADAVKLGYLLDASGPTQDISKTTLEGFKLYIDKLNKAGGVNGQSIDVMARDVQIDTKRAVSTAQELVTSEGAIAILGLPLSSTQMGIYTAMGRANVPVIAGYPSNIRVIMPPVMENAFGVGVVFDLMGWVGGDLARDVSADGKTMVCTTFESPGGIVSCKGAEAAAKKDGFEKTASVTFPIPLRDFRTIAEKIVSLNPDIVITVIGRGRTLAMLPALGAAGYKGKVLSMEAGTGDDVVREAAKAAPDLEVYSWARYVSSGYGKGEQVDALGEAASAAGINEWLTAHAGGWVLGMVVEDILKRCSSPCTAANFQAATENTHVDTGGLTGAAIEFTKDDHYGQSTYLLVRYDRAQDKMVPMGDWIKYSSTLPSY